LPGGTIQWSSWSLRSSVQYPCISVTDVQAYNSYVGSSGPTQCDLARGDWVCLPVYNATLLPSMNFSGGLKIFNGVGTTIWDLYVTSGSPGLAFEWFWVDANQIGNFPTPNYITANMAPGSTIKFAYVNVWDTRDGRKFMLFKKFATVSTPQNHTGSGSHWWNGSSWQSGNAPWLP